MIFIWSGGAEARPFSMGKLGISLVGGFETFFHSNYKLSAGKIVTTERQLPWKVVRSRSGMFRRSLIKMRHGGLESRVDLL